MLEPAGSSRAELLVRRSKFVGIARAFSDPAETKALLAQTREKHSGCNHVAYAYLVGPRGEQFGLSDDREPKGTAGRPILSVLRGSGITDAIVLIVRYFGGVKLGTGGLARAYGDTARLALADLPVREQVERVSVLAAVPYRLIDSVSRIISDCKGEIEDVEYGTLVRREGMVPAASFEEIRQRIMDASAGAISLRRKQDP